MSATAVPIRPVRKGSVLKLWLALLFLALIAGGIAWWGTAGQQVATTASGLRYRIVEQGTGEPMTAADVGLIHYVLRGQDGAVIQDSRQGGQPIPATTTSFIPGFNEALTLMRQGSVIEIWIPPSLGYGNQVPPGAPFGPNDTLQFRVEMLEIARGMAASYQQQQQMQQMQQMQQIQEMQRQGQSGEGGQGAATQNGAGPAGDSQGRGRGRGRGE